MYSMIENDFQYLRYKKHGINRKIWSERVLKKAQNVFHTHIPSIISAVGSLLKYLKSHIEIPAQ